MITGNVSHIGEKNGTDVVANLTESFVVESTRVAARAGHDDLRSIETSVGVQGIIVDESRLGIERVGQIFEEDRRGRDLLVGRVEAVREMSTVGQTQTHETTVRTEQSRVDGKVGWTAAQCLHVHAPFARVAIAEHLQCALLCQQFDSIDNLVASIVSLKI